MEGRPYQICSRCIMDTSDPRIVFDAGGVCNHCRRYIFGMRQAAEKGTWSAQNLERVISEIREAGKGKPYDVLMGLSGGVDSSYLALWAHQQGFRAFCVHLDNGWNSELAVKNIENIIRKYRFTLHTHVIDWEEFRDLQISMFKASVVDVEMITDQAIYALMYRCADAQNIRHILIGANHVSESAMPYSWAYFKDDLLNILDIHRQHGTHPLKTYPMLDPYRLWECREGKGIGLVYALNFLPYNPRTAGRTLEEVQGWRPYGRKHSESRFTRFYQEYYLPRKYNIDKRRVHLSNLIFSGILTREEALAEMKETMLDEAEAESLKGYVCKKLGLSAEDFEQIMMTPRREHFDYLTGHPPR